MVDDNRPLMHFTPASGWMNDPLGVTWHDGRYHLFFQYVPGRTTWAPDCRWGHATSTDLTIWSEQEPALEPGDGDDGIWSGSLVVDPEQGPVIFYTAVSVPDFGIGRVRTARPDDRSWSSWTKGDVVVETERDDLVAFRDPYVFRDGDQWRMFVGTAVRGGLAAASSFSSTDLQTWKSDGFAASRPTTDVDPVWTGSLWECPQLFEIDGRHVLVTSVWEDDELHYVAYGVGSYADGRFEADSWHRLTYGDGYYAPSFFRDADGRPCLIFWIRGVLDASGGRASALSVPHLLSLDDGVLQARPHPALQQRAVPTAIPTELDLDHAWEIVWRAQAGSRLSVGEGPDALTIEAGDHGVVARMGERSTEIGAIGLELIVLIDRQVVEVFGGDSAVAFGSEAVVHGVLRHTGEAPVTVRTLASARGDDVRQEG